MNTARPSRPETPRRALWTKPGNTWKNPTSVNAARTETNELLPQRTERQLKSLTTKDTKIHEGLSARSQLLRVPSCPLWLEQLLQALQVAHDLPALLFRQLGP